MEPKGRIIDVSEDILLDALSYYFRAHPLLSPLKDDEYLDFIYNVDGTEKFVLGIFLSKDIPIGN